jgi:hypothetical protein
MIIMQKQQDRRKVGAQVEFPGRCQNHGDGITICQMVSLDGGLHIWLWQVT